MVSKKVDHSDILPFQNAVVPYFTAEHWSLWTDPLLAKIGPELILVPVLK